MGLETLAWELRKKNQAKDEGLWVRILGGGGVSTRQTADRKLSCAVSACVVSPQFTSSSLLVIQLKQGL